MVEASKNGLIVAAAVVTGGLLLGQLLATRQQLALAQSLQLSLLLSAGVVIVSWLFSLELITVLVGYTLEFNSVVSLMGALLLFVVAAVSVSAERSFRFVLSMLLLLCGLLMVGGVGALMVSSSDVLLGLFGSASGIVVVAVLTILLAVHHLETVRTHPWFFWLALVFLVVGCYFVSLVAAVHLVLVPLLLFIVGRVWGTSFARSELQVPLWPVVAVTFLVLSTIIAPPPNATFMTLTEERMAPAFTDTYTVAGRAVTEDLRHFLIGYGPGTFKYVWNLYQPEHTYYRDDWDREYPYGATIVLTVLVEYGMIGLLALVSGFGVIGFRLYQMAWLRSMITISSALLLAGCLFLLAVLLAVLLPPTALVWLFVIVLTGVAAGFGGLITLKPTRSQGWSIARTITGGLMCVALLVLALANWRSVLLYEQALLATYQQADAGKAYSYLEQAIALMPKAQYYRTLSKLQQDQIYILINYEGDVNEADRSALKLLTSLALANAETAANQERSSYVHWVVLGNMYTTIALLGAEDAVVQAQNMYNEAKRLAPYSPLPAYVMAEIDYIAGDYEGALVELQYALAAKGDYVPALNLLKRIQLDGDTSP